MYYNSVVVNVFKKGIIWLAFFVIGLPLSFAGRKLFGQDSDNMYSWPNKYFFSGTMMLFFAMLQPLALASFAEVTQGQSTESEYEYASYSLAFLILTMIAISIANNVVLILRHY